MSDEASNVLELPMLELDDIQSGVLRPRPTPYAATYIVFRIDARRAEVIRVRVGRSCWARQVGAQAARVGEGEVRTVL